MGRAKRIIWITAMGMLLSSCAGMSQQQRGTALGGGIGAGVGAITGQAIGHNTRGTLIGAGIGALIGGIVGNQVGAYMDRQEQALRSAMASGQAANISRARDILTATFRSEVLFDYNSSALKPGAYVELARVADVLRRYPQTAIRVEGHADERGTERYNQRLSEERARAIKNALAQMGVAADRITAAGYGESQPVSSSDAMNRRVDIIITPDRQRWG